MEEQTKREPGKKKLKKGLMVLLFVVCGIVWIGIIACAIHFENLLSLINRADDEILETMSDAQYQAMMDAMQETVPEDYTGEVLSAEDVDWGEEIQLIEQSEDVINFLLIGQDRRTQDGRSRSDTIILVTVNKPAKTLTLTSFMRDLYVQIPGRSNNRINVPYLIGGEQLLDSCIQQNFGVTMDGNAVVDFYGFIDIVDLMGGVDIELSAAEAEYMNNNFSWDVDDGQDDNWNLVEGINHLNGSQTLSYARMRKVGNADHQRTERQRTVLTKLIEKAKDLSVAELNMLLQHALPMITTDLDNGQILAYALEIFPLLPELEINTMKIPMNGTYEGKYIDGMAVMVPNLWSNRMALQNIMAIPETE